MLGQEAALKLFVCCFLVIQMGGRSKEYECVGAVFVITGVLILLVFDNGF
jgi:hypothetical protein